MYNFGMAHSFGKDLIAAMAEAAAHAQGKGAVAREHVRAINDERKSKARRGKR